MTKKYEIRGGDWLVEWHKWPTPEMIAAGAKSMAFGLAKPEDIFRAMMHVAQGGKVEDIKPVPL